jgi:hypothetical protein
MPIQVDLDREGEPGRDTHMHEAQFPVNEVKIQAQAFSGGVNKMGSILSVGKFEALAGFHSAEHTYEPFCDPIPISDLPGFFFLSNHSIDVNEGPFVFFSDCTGMLFDPFGVFGNKPLEILQQKTLSHHKSFHVFCPTDGQESFEQNSIKTGCYSSDFSCMIIDKFFHGVLPSVAVWELPH